jgi:hypothetical protein
MCFDYEIPQKGKLKNRELEESIEVEVEPEREEEQPIVTSAN